MSAFIYIEGGARGADSKWLNIRCQEGFHKLLDRMGFKGRKPRIVACGSRGAVYERFAIEHSKNVAGYVAMWIDSEEPMANPKDYDRTRALDGRPAARVESGDLTVEAVPD